MQKKKKNQNLNEMIGRNAQVNNEIYESINNKLNSNQNDRSNQY